MSFIIKSIGSIYILIVIYSTVHLSRSIKSEEKKQFASSAFRHKEKLDWIDDKSENESDYSGGSPDSEGSLNEEEDYSFEEEETKKRQLTKGTR